MKFNERHIRIYSRHQIRFLKNSSNKLHYKFMVAIIIAAITIVFFMSWINPVIDEMSISQVENKVSRITHNQTEDVIKNYKYSDLVSIVLDNENNISMIQMNTNTINKISSEVTSNILEKLKENKNCDIAIYMGSLFGIPLLSGTGPKIHAKITSSSNLNTNIKSEFSASGINQTLHKIYLEINMTVSILTPYHSLTTKTKNMVLLSESIIVGKVPESYYYLDSGNPTDLID